MLEEGAVVAVLLAVILAAQLALSGSFYLLSRNLWLDEIVTNVLVSDENVLHSLGAIASGLDTNPPVYHLLLRVFRMLVRHGGEATLRSFSLISMLAALVALYLNLRQVYLPLTALAGVLAVWSHPLLLRCAFGARMYAPWFAAVVWFAYLLGRSWNAATHVWLRILLACSSFLTCTLHTLGALSLGLVLSAHLLFHHSAQWDWLTLGWASFGPVALLGWLPLLWKQNFANPVTWLKAPTKHSVADFARGILIPKLLATILVLGAGLSAFLPGSSETVGTMRHDPSNPAMLAGLAGLVLLPIGLVALSCAVQPLLDDRYATPTVASFAPAIAALLSPLPSLWLAALCGLFLMIGATHLSSLRREYWTKDRETTELIQAIVKHAGQEPVFFETLLELSVVSHYAQNLAQRCYVLDFETGQLGGVDDLRIANRNHARLLARFYSRFSMMPWESVRVLPRLYLVPSGTITLKLRCSDLGTRYRGFRAVSLDAGLYELVRA
jgi:hypothetical protein